MIVVTTGEQRELAQKGKWRGFIFKVLFLLIRKQELKEIQQNANICSF